MRKKLAIISSYNDSCGNAFYTEALRREFTKYYDVDVLRLDIDLLSSVKTPIRKLADAHIRELASRLRKYDFVNIQFELGLYGANMSDVKNRVFSLINASPNVILTMHRLDIQDGAGLLKYCRRFLKHGLRETWKVIRFNQYAKVYESIIGQMKKKSIKENAHIIVHTKRDQKMIEQLFGFQNVHAFPLTFLNAEARKRIPEAAQKKAFTERYGLSRDDIVIGLFGFVNEYKGHETAILALNHLPSQYKLIIFGSQHPMSYQTNKLIDGYLEKLIFLTTKKRKVKRVLFAGSLNDSDFIDALYCCDFAVLPYLEVNQSGSGIASLVLESKIKSLYSNNRAFKELAKYFPNAFETFDMGNYLELAYKIQNYSHDFTDALDGCFKTYNHENNVGLYRTLFEGTAGGADH